MWLTPAGVEQPVMAGGSPELDAERGVQPEAVAVAVLAGAATLFFGIVPSPLFHLARDAAGALGLL